MVNSEKEIWRAYPDIPEIEVSTFGRVRTLDRVVSSEKMTRLQKGRVLKQSDNGKGYLQVSIMIDRKRVTKRVHRLVSQTFIKNPDKLPEVNHKDSNRANNNVDNLEWVTHQENIAYRDKFGKALGHPIFAINLDTLEVSRFRSQREASRELGVLQSSVHKVIKGRRNSTGGYWFVNDDGHAVDVVKSKLHDVGGIGLKIKHRASIKKIFS